MLNPFLLMAVFYLFVAILAAVDAALANFTLLPWYPGLPWLRVHFITLGVLAEIAFGVLPLLMAARRAAPKPAVRWDIWLLLNAGLIVLWAGIPSVNAVLIITGGSLIFAAATLLLFQLRTLAADPTSGPRTGSFKFYVAGLSYLLLGILIGTGLWVGWAAPLRIGVPKEAHIHANSWGFAALVFVGLLIDILPQITAAPLASRRSVTAIFWGMTLGAFGLVAGPWLGGLLVATVSGLVLHIAATVWLLVALIGSLRRAGLFAAPGAWHLVLSYTWILLPVIVAPLILAGVAGIPGADVEATAPQALIYGWMLQFVYAAAPYLLARWLLGDRTAGLGGNWLSLAAVNTGSAAIWLSIFVVALRSQLQGLAYVLLAASLLAAAWQMGKIAFVALRQAERQAEQQAEPLSM